LHWIRTLTLLDVSTYTCTLATKLICRHIVLFYAICICVLTINGKILYQRDSYKYCLTYHQDWWKFQSPARRDHNYSCYKYMIVRIKTPSLRYSHRDAHRLSITAYLGLSTTVCLTKVWKQTIVFKRESAYLRNIAFRIFSDSIKKQV